MTLSDLGLNSQAISFLRYFESTTVLPEDGYAEEFATSRVSTTPYFNRRERGFVISVEVKPMKLYRRWAFYEHRVSDGLQVLAWEDDRFIFGEPLTHKDVPSEAWGPNFEGTASFKNGDFGEAGRYLERELRAALELRESFAKRPTQEA